MILITAVYANKAIEKKRRGRNLAIEATMENASIQINCYKVCTWPSSTMYSVSSERGRLCLSIISYHLWLLASFLSLLRALVTRPAIHTCWLAVFLSRPWYALWVFTSQPLLTHYMSKKVQLSLSNSEHKWSVRGILIMLLKSHIFIDFLFLLIRREIVSLPYKRLDITAIQ